MKYLIESKFFAESKKYLKTFEERKNVKVHNPKHLYDCDNCKFHWCCGFECSCILKTRYNVNNVDLPDAPHDSEYGKYKEMIDDIKNFNL